MKDDNFEKYHEALYKGIIFIQNNIDEIIDLEDIAEESGYSLYHFHRIFSEMMGESLKSYIRRIRLENAAFRLATKNEPIIDIAMDSGFHTPETFSRAFNKHFGKLPSKYTRKIDLYDDSNITHIEKIYFKGRTCLFKRHLGRYEDSGTPYEKNSIWEKVLLQSNLKSKDIWDHELFGISHDDPSITKGKDIRFDACISIPTDHKANYISQKIQKGLYIVATFEGGFEQLVKSYNYIIYKWLKLYNLLINHNLPPFEQYYPKCIKIYIPIL